AASSAASDSFSRRRTEWPPGSQRKLSSLKIPFARLLDFGPREEISVNPRWAEACDGRTALIRVYSRSRGVARNRQRAHHRHAWRTSGMLNSAGSGIAEFGLRFANKGR